MKLYDKLNQIAINEWRYYDDIAFSNYEKATENPLNFIESYFYYAKKNEFLYQSLFDFNQKDNEEQNVRAIHTVNIFFLGLYLKEMIDFLKPHKNSFLSKDNNFLWAWFLCSLYHDAYFNIENNAPPPNCYYNCFSKGLLYDCDLIKRYYEKEHNPNTSHNKKINYDHGIVSAEKLYSNYINIIIEKVENEPNAFKDFIANKDLNHYNLRINYSTFCAMCKIAKIIACHNIFVANDKTKDKYENVNELIPGNKNFSHMPNIKNRHTMNSYEKLYFLLALVDTLEPSKREIDLNDIDIRVKKIQTDIYELKIDISTPDGDQDKYYNGIIQLDNWLNFIETNKDGKTIYINFKHNKNH